MIEDRKIYTYEEALQKSKEYFKGDDLAAKVFVDKYVLKDFDNNILEDNPDQMFHRITKEIYRIEKKKFKKPMSYDEIYFCLKEFKYIIPQGSCLSGIGNYYQYTSLSNCFCGNSPLDSYSSICKTDEEIVQISKRRGGIGFDISHLRPAGSPTTNSAKTSTGIIPFCERYSNTIREVGQNSRRGALILTLSIHHPEILAFTNMKRDITKIIGANISIRLSDEFLNAVKKDQEYELRWPVESSNPVISKKVKAKEVWMNIIDNAWHSAEPGLLFWDNIINESPAECYKDFGFKTVSVNPCSELSLSALDSCRLLLLNLFSFVDDPFTKNAKFNFEKFYKYAQIAQRFMDNIIDLELEHTDRIIKKIKKDPEPIDIKRNELNMWQKIRESCYNGRRTGTGATAVGDVIAACGLQYGSTKSIKLINDIFKTLKLGCYRSSVDMAKELGAFEIWDHNLEKNCPFLLRIKNEDEKLWNDMKKYGRRNIGILTLAPAGSMSILTQTTSGIEPLFKTSYKRRKKIDSNDKDSKVDFIDNNNDSWQEFIVYHPKLKNWTEITGETDIKKSPWFNSCAEDIDWHARIKLQAIINTHIDHSIAATINLPEDVSKEEVADIYETAWREKCKGITVYRKNSRSGVLIDNKQPTISKNNAPKRPKFLSCDIHHTSVKGEIYFVIIGLLNNIEPYEIFAGKGIEISKNIKHNLIGKIKRGKYAIYDSNKNIIYEDISKYIGEEQESLTRIISMALRHGATIDFVVHQLEKTRGDMLGFSKAICRVLKKYIKEGNKVIGENCPECNGELMRIEGCATCTCGWTKCS